MPNIVAVVKRMTNSNFYSRRNFLSHSWSDLLNKPQNKSSLLHPIETLNAQFRKQMPPIENEVLFLNRSSFGIRPADYVRVKSIGIENYLEEQLDYQSIDNSELESLLETVYPLLKASLPDIVAYIQEGTAMGEDRASDAAIQLVSATMMRQLYSNAQLYELMVEFWNNHFNIDLAKGFCLFLKVYEDNSIIRPNALSSFSQILHADSKSSAMMFYLDNYSNSKFGPNENYARELMELHTLGVEGGYTEEDVKEVARCFTGWSIGENDSDFFQYYPENHDTEQKTVLGTVISNEQGIKDGEQVLDLLAGKSATAVFIAKKLVRRFCSDQSDIQLVRTVAKNYLSTGGDIKEMLRTIFHSRQFLDSVDSKYKRPVEFVSSLYRSLDAESVQQVPEQKFYPLYALIAEYEAGGHMPFLWSPPTGYPDVEAYWNNVSSLLRRINFATGTALGDIFYFPEDNIRYADLIDYDFAAIVQDAETSQEIITMIENALLYRELLEQDKALLVEFLETEENGPSETRIRAVIGVVLSSAYFQLR